MMPESGGCLGPLVLGIVVDRISLLGGAVMGGVLGSCAALWMIGCVRETLVREREIHAPSGSGGQDRQRAAYTQLASHEEAEDPDAEEHSLTVGGERSLGRKLPEHSAVGQSRP